MFNLRYRTTPRPTRQEHAEPKPERPLPRVFVRKLECDLAQHDKIARVLMGRRPG